MKSRHEDGSTAWVGVDPGSVHTRVVRLTTTGTSCRTVPTVGDRAAALRSALATEDAARLAVVVPDAWSETGPDGAGLREVMRRIVLEKPVFAQHSVVESSLAVAACAVAEGLVDTSCVVCDVGARGVTAAWCEVEGTAVRLAASETVSCASFDEALAVDAQCEQLHAALDQFHRRGTHALNAALRLSRYRGTPVYRVADSWLTADSVINAFEPFVTAIRVAVTGLLPQSGPVLLAGGFARFPLTAHTVTEVVGEPPVVMSGDAAARGAAHLARGTVHASRAPGRLLVERVADGLLEIGDLPLDAEPIVEVAPDSSPHMTVRCGAVTGVTAGPALTAGRYRAAWWPNRGDLGAVVLRPLDGGQPLLYPLVEAP